MGKLAELRRRRLRYNPPDADQRMARLAKAYGATPSDLAPLTRRPTKAKLKAFSLLVQYRRERYLSPAQWELVALLTERGSR